ncbi:MAG TPA: beta-galactosidase [Tepidisphaeraceae bacterium]|nr:beta-galactosidase [Tepidisphaeraceae bacterium]
MKIGTYYYPEQWPREDWEKDFDRIVSMGLQIVHLAEFAWGSLEPARDRFEFGWLDRALELAQERKLDVILCTPTAIIPIWMVDEQSDVLFTGQRFGGRRHANHLHPFVSERSKKIVEAMANRYGNHSSVIGWQIDNEVNMPFDQSEHTRRAYQQWLKSKYETIESVNDAWGCAFWNTFYTSFEQIRLAPSRDPEYRNPHECVDSSRFLSASLAEYSRMQAKILKPKIGARWITTNFMPFHPDTNPSDFSDHLSLFSWDTYPITGWGKEFKDERFRISDPSAVGVIHDQMRSFTNRWALMEVQPGQVNWSGYPVRLMPGAVRLMLWQAIVKQCEFITVYRFKQPRFGVELFHDGLVQWDGETPSAGGLEFMQTIEDVKKLEKSELMSSSTYAPLMPDPEIPEVGLFYNQDQHFNYLSQQQSKRWSLPKLVTNYHAAIERVALPVRVVQESSDFTGLKLLVVPGASMMDDSFIQKLSDYVRAGGHLILTARSAMMDHNGRIPQGLYSSRLYELIGAKITGYDSLPDETFGEVEFDRKKHRWGAWAEMIEPTTAQALGTFTDQFYASSPAVIQNQFGSGTVTFVGAIDQGSLSDAVVEFVAKQIDLPVEVLPRRTRLHRMKGASVFLNFNDKAVTAPAGGDAKFLIGERRVAAAGVAIWTR